MDAHTRDVERFEHGHRLADLRAEEEVAPCLHEIDDGEILIDRCDSGIQSVAGRAELGFLPIDLHHSGIRLMQSRDDLDQRRLARAVVAQHARDLPGPNREIDADEGADVHVRLGDARHLDERRRHWRGHRLIRADICLTFRFNNTAPSNMIPRKNLNQLGSQPA